MNKKRSEYQKQYWNKYKSRTRRVNLTLSNEEHQAFLRSAKTENEKLTSHIKKLSLSGLTGKAHIPPELKEELKTLRYAIYNIANNVNQIAHYSNTIHSMTSVQENNLLQHLKQLDEVIQNYTQGRILLGKKN